MIDNTSYGFALHAALMVQKGGPLAVRDLRDLGRALSFAVDCFDRADFTIHDPPHWAEMSQAAMVLSQAITERVMDARVSAHEAGDINRHRDYLAGNRAGFDDVPYLVTRG